MEYTDRDTARCENCGHACDNDRPSWYTCAKTGQPHPKAYYCPEWYPAPIHAPKPEKEADPAPKKARKKKAK